jgi:hypothetical protein
MADMVEKIAVREPQLNLNFLIQLKIAIPASADHRVAASVFVWVSQEKRRNAVWQPVTSP